MKPAIALVPTDTKLVAMLIIADGAEDDISMRVTGRQES